MRAKYGVVYKKLLLGSAIVFGLVNGTGNDIGTIRHQMTSSSNEGARGFTAGDNHDWGEDSGY